MRAITICQPYAHLIATGEKRIENRTWPTSHRGLLAIHAGKSQDWLAPDDDPRRYTFGAVVAMARLVDCVRLEHLPAHLKGHEHALGPWCWVLEDVTRFPEPIPARGAQGLWEWTR
jgi:hypothetical protein